MSRYIVSPAADRDVQQIYSWIARNGGTQNADRVLLKIMDAFDLIARMPGVGHVRAELEDDTLRVTSVFKYLVIYDPTRRPLEIIRVIHGAMDLGPEFLRGQAPG